MDSIGPQFPSAALIAPQAIILQVFPAAAPAPPRVWTVFVAFVAVFATVIAVGIVQAIVVIALGGGVAVEDFLKAYTEFLKTSTGLLAMSPASLAVGSAALLGAALSPTPWRLRLRLVPTAHPILLSLAGVVGMLAVGHTIECTIALLGIPRGGALAVFSEVFSSLTGIRLVLAVLIVGFLAGTCEELLFRGYIQTRLENRWGSPMAILITALLFGLLHMDLLHSPSAAIMGVFLGYLTARAGSVWPAIVAHVGNNIASTLMSAWHVDAPGTWGWLMGALLLMTLCIVAIRTLTTPAASHSAQTTPPRVA